MYLKVISLLSALACLHSAVGLTEYCYNDVVGACSPVGGDLQNCNAKYGAAHEVLRELQNYVNIHITRNFQFLLMSSHFGNYEKNREGFAKLYRHLSDDTWEKSIELIKYIGKRGGSMDFRYKKQMSNDLSIDNYEMYELGSLGKALDIMKSLGEEAHFIHGEVTRRRESFHDPEVASYLENNFVHQHAEVIRELAGHSNDLKQMISQTADSSLSLFLFDNYLKKL